MAANSASSRAKEVMARWRARLLERRPGLIALLFAASAIALGAGLTFRRATTPWSVLPDNDYWGNIRGLINESGLALSLGELFRHNNEHIVVIPKLIYAANYLLTGGSNIGLIIYSLCVGAACAIILLSLAQDLLRDTPARWVFCALLFPLAIFSAKLSHSYYFGMSGTIWLTADMMVILSMAALAKAAKLQSIRWLLASVLAALLGVLTYSTAIYALLVLLVFCGACLLVPRFRNLFPWLLLTAIAVALVALLALLQFYRPHPKGHPPLDFDPIGLAGFVLVYLGSAISNGYWQPVMGLAILAAGALAIRRLLAEGRGSDIFLWVALFFFAPFNALMTGIGRLGFGLKAAMSSRYQSVTAISLIAAIALVLAALPRENVSRRAALIRGATLAALAAMAVFFLTNTRTTKLYERRLEPKPLAEIALRQNLAGKQHIRAATPAINQFQRVLPVLRGARHVPFDRQSRCEDVMGQLLAPTSSTVAGAIETMSAYEILPEKGRSAVELSGWAVKHGRPADCIAIVDGDGIVIGAGVSASMRPDPASKRPLRIGWRAVAHKSERTPICAYALFPGSMEWTPLGDCQTNMTALTQGHCVSGRFP
jgi:hypothetical protein